MLQVLAIRDRQLNGYMQPFTAHTVGLGLRAFSDLVNANDSEMHKHPEDYELYHVGEFDEQTGILQPCMDANGKPQPQQVALATNVLRQR